MKYVYAYCDPRKPLNKTILDIYFEFEPFYIGKGNHDRIYIHLYKSRHKRNLPIYAKISKLQKLGYIIPIVICKELNSDEEACSIEMMLIETIGRKDKNLGPLVNLSDGGEGCYSMSEESKNKQRATRIGITLEEYKEMSKDGKGYCSYCKMWKYFKGSYCNECRVIYNKKKKNESLKSECNNDVKIINFYENLLELNRARKSNLTLIEYYNIIQTGKMWCNHCQTIKDEIEMKTKLKCKKCYNKKVASWGRKKRGMDKQLDCVNKIIKDINLSKAIIQSAKRNKIDIKQYTAQVLNNKRYCQKCKQWLNKKDFIKRNERTLGVHNTCKYCKKLNKSS